MRALILVDLQNDFLPGGSLAVPRGDEVIPVCNRIQGAYELVVATQDWHPADHLSFASQHAGKEPGDRVELDGLEQVLWPDHCVQGTPGARLAPGLDTSRLEHIVQKGTDRAIDSYSGFFDNGHRRATGLGRYLEERGVDEVHIAGLATEYCVLFTALDAVRLGFRAGVFENACRGVDLEPGDVERAWRAMRAKGVSVLRSEG